jgi:AcrR family transcriptional regulator
MNQKEPAPRQPALSAEDIRIAPGGPAAGVEVTRVERSDAAENRRRILGVAERLFAESSVAQVNMQDIARAAGVGQGTLYRRFANKGELCMALLDTQMVEFQNEVLAELRAQNFSRQPRLVQLKWFLDALVHFSDRHAPLLCGAMREGMTPTVDRRQSPFVWQHMTVTGLLNAAVHTREARPELDVPLIAEVLLAPLHPVVFESIRRDNADMPLSRISAGLQQIVDGLRRS